MYRKCLSLFKSLHAINTQHVSSQTSRETPHRRALGRKRWGGVPPSALRPLIFHCLCGKSIVRLQPATRWGCSLDHTQRNSYTCPPASGVTRSFLQSRAQEASSSTGGGGLVFCPRPGHNLWARRAFPTPVICAFHIHVNRVCLYRIAYLSNVREGKMLCTYLHKCID